MTIKDIIEEIEPLGSPRTKKRYMSQGAVEPLFGMSIKALKPIAKKIMAQDNRQTLAYELFDTGNYDLMYLAGMVVDPEGMTEEKFNDWLDKSYCHMLDEFTISICLSERDDAMEIAEKWLDVEDDQRMSVGYLTFCWLLASRKDEFFDRQKLQSMLPQIEKKIHGAPNRTRYAMYYFVYNLGVSYKPLSYEAMKSAEIIGDVEVVGLNGKMLRYNPKAAIDKELERGNLGFKRRNVRC